MLKDWSAFRILLRADIEDATSKLAGSRQNSDKENFEQDQTNM